MKSKLFGKSVDFSVAETICSFFLLLDSQTGSKWPEWKSRNQGRTLIFGLMIFNWFTRWMQFGNWITCGMVTFWDGDLLMLVPILFVANAWLLCHLKRSFNAHCETIALYAKSCAMCSLCSFSLCRLVYVCWKMASKKKRDLENIQLPHNCKHCLLLNVWCYENKLRATQSFVAL